MNSAFKQRGCSFWATLQIARTDQISYQNATSVDWHVKFNIRETCLSVRANVCTQHRGWPLHTHTHTNINTLARALFPTNTVRFMVTKRWLATFLEKFDEKVACVNLRRTIVSGCWWSWLHCSFAEAGARLMFWRQPWLVADRCNASDTRSRNRRRKPVPAKPVAISGTSDMQFCSDF